MNPLKKNLPLLLLLLTVAIGTCFHLRKTREKIHHRLEKVEFFEARLHGMDPPQKSADEKFRKIHVEEDRSLTTENKSNASADKLRQPERQPAAKKTYSPPSRQALFSQIFPNLDELCRAGDNEACQLLHIGPTSQKLYRYTCSLAAKACLEAAEADERSGHLQLASQNFRTACHAENQGEACLRHLHLLENFAQAGFDDRMEYFTLACDQQLAEGCLHLAELYLDLGHQKLYDHYYRTACQLSPTAEFPLCPQYR